MTPRLALLAVLALSACKKAPAPPPLIAQVTTPRAEAAAPTPRCDVSIEQPASTAAGARGVAQVTLRAMDGFHVNQEAPLEIRVASDDLDLPRTRFGVAEASLLAPEEVRVDVPFSARTAGAKSLSVHARFGICSDVKCAECRQQHRLSPQID